MTQSPYHDSSAAVENTLDVSAADVFVFPASFAQQRLWLLDQLVPGCPAYTVPTAVRLTGPLDMAALEQSICEVVRRHEALRTTFTTVGGQPFQVIDPALTVPVRMVDLREFPEAEREAQALRLATLEVQRPFDLAQGPLLRVTLLRLGEEAHVLLPTMHHIVSDGWSMGVLIREMAGLYQAFSTGKPSPLPELPIQYADFAVWQQQWLQEEVLETHLSYWKQQLSGVPILRLPTDRPRPAEQTFRGAMTKSFMLPPALTEGLKALSRREGVTLFMTLLAAFQTLLCRYTGQDDIVVGSPIANRNRSELEGLIGLFVNMLVLRSDLSGNPSFRELLGRVREACLGAYAHQDLPFEKLVEELNPKRDMSRSPLFQVAFDLLNAPMPPLKLKDLTLNILEVDPGSAKLDLSLGLYEGPEGLGGLFEYNTDLFDHSTITRMAEHFQNVLAGIVADPEQRLSDLPLLTEAEQQQVLVEWNATEADYPKDTPVHQLFEAQAERTPEAVAVVFEDQQLSYAELNIRANQLAHYLKKKGVGPGSVVAITQGRLPEMIISILATLKAGGIYLPIDEHIPEDRLLFMLNDSKANFVLTHDRFTKVIPFSSLQNLQHAGEGMTITTTRPQIKDFDSLPFPDRSLVDYSKYNQYVGEGCVKRHITIQATRGCPYKCVYCHKVWPKTHVFRSAQNIFQEVMLHYDEGYRTFCFLDDIFNLNRKNSEEFFNLIIKNNLKIRILFPNGVRGDLLTKDYIELMAEAGVIQMSLALETASPRLQRLIKKNLKIEILRENIEHICKKHPHIILDLFAMFGFPTETEEEALMSLDFIKSFRWLDFPQLFAVRIFPNTDLARLAMEHGVTKESIERSAAKSYNETSVTMPFSKRFMQEYWGNFAAFIMAPERLESVIPIQGQVLARDELTAKYDSYLGGLKSYPEVERLIDSAYLKDVMPSENGVIESSLSAPTGEKASSMTSDTSGKLRVLLLDLSKFFTSDYDRPGLRYSLQVVEAPLGLMYLQTYLNREFGSKLHGKILKSMVDFDSFEELKCMIDDFQPQVIGIRALSMQKEFFHKTVSLLKQWCRDVPIITGGPYATSEYNTVLSDRNVDVVVRGEGELTFSELIENILENDGELPGDDDLSGIAGLAFVPNRRGAARESAGLSREVLLLDKIADEIAHEGTDNREIVNRSTDTACVMYVSGSTGRPKGIAIPHHGISRLVLNTNYVKLEPSDRIAQVANFSFDVSTFEIWGALLNGACIVGISREAALSPPEFAKQILEQEISVLFLTTALFNHIASELPRSFETLKCLLFGGEAVDARCVKRVIDHGPPKCLLHVYGTTESTTLASWYSVSQVPEGTITVPIGRPISNTQIYLLDRNLNPVPVGVPGEICIGGDGLAHGYINQDELTAERFIPNPFGNGSGECLYRTGDLARYLPDGNIEFLGRLDHQVKVRGYRIELGEVEAVLGQHPAVQEVVVLAREDVPGERRLVAYVVVPHQEPAPTISELCRFSKEKLPDYMVPSAFAFLEVLPLTPNGKVDRRALPAPGGARPELEKGFVAPRTPVEELLAGVWAQLLEVEQVGVHDNFYDLGGDSMKAAQLASKISAVMERDIPARLLLLCPTIADLVDALAKPTIDGFAQDIGDAGQGEFSTAIKEMTVMDLDAEAVLDPTIFPEEVPLDERIN